MKTGIVCVHERLKIGAVEIVVMAGPTETNPGIPAMIMLSAECLGVNVIVRDPAQLERLAEIISDAAIARRQQLRSIEDAKRKTDDQPGNA